MGELLRQARLAAGLTQDVAGARLVPPVNAPYLSDVERGVRPVSAERLAQLARTYGLAVDSTHTLFVTAGLLPPDVAARTLAAPETWTCDPQRLFTLLVDALPHLPGPLFDRATSVLDRYPW